MEITDFSERYKTFTNAELVEVLDNPGSYQSLAVEAAHKEFSKRQLSDAEIEAAKEPSIARRLQQEEQQLQLNAIKEKVKSNGRTFLETFNFVQSETPSTEKTARVIVIVFGALFLYQGITGFHFIRISIKHFARDPFLTIWMLLPVILLPAAVITLWKRKAAGWVLLMIYLLFCAVNTIFPIVYLLTHRQSAFGNLNRFFQMPPLSGFIIQLIFLLATIVILCKENMRTLFLINKELMTKVIIMTTIMTFLLYFLIYK